MKLVVINLNNLNIIWQLSKRD